METFITVGSVESGNQNLHRSIQLASQSTGDQRTACKPSETIMRTFENWITKIAHFDDDPRGDFILDTRDVIESGRWKDGEVTSLAKLRSKMQQVSWSGFPCSGAYAQAAICWKQYQQAARSR
jgi:hypothetical protein